MPEGLQTVIVTADAVGAEQNTTAVPIWHQGTSDSLARVGDDIRILEREIAFLDALCRCYEEASLAA
jgi:hypothetical protein